MCNDSYLVYSSSDTMSAMDDSQRLFQLMYLKYNCIKSKVETIKGNTTYLDQHCASHFSTETQLPQRNCATALDRGSQKVWGDHMTRPTAFLPCDAMHKCGLYYHAGWLSVCLSHSGIVSKWLTYPQTFFTFWYPHHSSFSTRNIIAKFQWVPP